jgi:hypothetical protein
LKFLAARWKEPREEYCDPRPKGRLKRREKNRSPGKSEKGEKNLAGARIT